MGQLDQKPKKPYVGSLLMTFFLFFALFGLAFGLAIIFLKGDRKTVSSQEVVPIAEVILPKNSPTPSPTPTPNLVSQARVGEGCKVGGCNSEICLNENDEVATSICLYKEVYSCYQSAECQRQDNKKCDWSQTRELTSCIKASEETGSKDQLCGGIAGTPCPSGYFCKLDGSYPDDHGKCEKD